MARNAAVSIENNFVNGLVTEATALNFPEAAAIDTNNCVFNTKGNVTRRRGFDNEDGYVYTQLSPADYANKAIATFLWENAAGNGDHNFVVLQVGTQLYFYKVGNEGSLSAGAMNFGFSVIDLDDFKAPGAPGLSEVEAQFASGSGYLFVTHQWCQPFRVKYLPDTQTFTTSEITFKIRDFEGMESDENEVNTRPTDLSTAHSYNIRNQGWPQKYIDRWRTKQTADTPSGRKAAAARGDWPSNADVWWLFKDSVDYFDLNQVNNIDRGNSPAPKGYFLLNPFYQDRSAVSGVTGIPVVSSGYWRPSTVAFFASRVFYAGVNAQGFSNKIYFSQVIEADGQFGKCHQVNDPTSEFQFDLLPTDGGQLSILDAGTIIKLVSIQGNLIVFATNGVWSITGSTGTGFAANDFTVKRLSSVPSLSPSSFVDVGGNPAWWNSDGIYTISSGDALGNIQVVSLSEKKIKEFYSDEIPAASKAHAKGFYNSLTRTVQWMYRSSEATTITERYRYDSVLNLNVQTGAFYPWSLSTDTSIRLNGLVAIHGFGSTTEEVNVTDNAGVQVTTSTGDNVTVRETVQANLASVFKYLISYTDASGNIQMTFAEESDEDYVDFATLTGGTDYTSYVVSGYKVRGDAQRKFQSNYLFVFSDNEDPSTYFVQAQWDYAKTRNSGNWSSRQKVVFTDASDYDYRWKRLKIRGTGLAMQLRFTSVSGQPMDLTGWTIFETGNARV